MAERYDLRRLGRVDTLVTVAVCLLLVLLVPVLLAKPREQSARILCAANLSQIGKTMFPYAGDNEGIFPRPGGQWTQWGPTTNWMATSRTQAFRMAPDASGGWATISSSFYLLVKYYQMPPRLFLCRGDRGATEFNLSRLSASLPPNFSLIDAWDFGPQDESPSKRGLPVQWMGTTSTWSPSTVTGDLQAGLCPQSIAGARTMRGIRCLSTIRTASLPA
jgi:hypothetical protein